MVFLGEAHCTGLHARINKETHVSLECHTSLSSAGSNYQQVHTCRKLVPAEMLFTE